MAKEIGELALSVFCRNMGMMLAAGIDAGEAVALLMEDVQPGAFASMLHTLNAHMEEGEGLSAAAGHTDLPEYLTSMLEVGERSGRLDECFQSLADYYERLDGLHKRLKSALLYPLVMLMLMCAVLAVLVFAVLPVFTRVYESLSGGLSGTSYSYVAEAAIIGRVSLVLAALVCAVVLGTVGAYYTRKGRPVVLRLLRKLPVAGAALKQLEIARLTEVLSTLLSSGLDADSAMEAAVTMVDDAQVREMALACEKDMILGAGLAQSFQKHRMLEPLYGRMLLSGAHSGNLETTLARLAGTLGQDAEDGLCAVIETVEPVLTGFLTVAVGLTLLCTMLPLVGILAAIG